MAGQNRSEPSEGEVISERADTLALSLTREPWHLHIAGKVENYDVALAMLAQATRYFEALLRAQAAQQLVAGPRIAAPGTLEVLDRMHQRR